MPVYYDVNGALLSEEEFLKAPTPVKDKRARRRRPLVAPTEAKARKTGRTRGAAPAERGITDHTAPTSASFVEIGLGKPLTIWVTSAYAGDLPPKGLFGGKGGLVSSAVKSWSYQDAQPRALNMIKKSVERRNEIVGAGNEPGTQILFYSPALVDRSLKVTVEMAFDDVNEDFYDGISKVLMAAGSLPVFLPYSSYLLLAGSLVKIGASLANRLFDGGPEFQASEDFKIDLPGAPAAAGYRLMTRSDLDRQTLQEFTIDNGKLVSKRDTSKAYDGPTPYVVLALDGQSDTQLEGFSARAASAAVLQTFYGIREDGESSADNLIQALTLLNDFKYNTEAKDLANRLKAGNLSPTEKDRLEGRRAAVAKNIRTTEFQIK